MPDPHLSTVIQNGDIMDELFTYLYIQYQSNREPVGYKIERASSDRIVKRIDKNFEEFTPGPNFFLNHELFQFPKCILTSAGTPYFGSNLRGDGINSAEGYIDINGTRHYGDVMARIQNPQYRYEYDAEDDIQYYLFAPYDSNHTYFDYFPSAYSGGGTRNKYFYIGCKEGSLGVDSSGNKIIRSVSGAQPWTGGEIRSLNFTSGGTVAFTKGESLTGATSGATGYVVDYYVGSGTWAGGDAAGVVYLSLPGISVTTATAFQAEALTGSVSGTDCATASGAATALTLSIDNALTYSANKGAGWTIENAYHHGVLKGLFFTQFGTRDSQTAIGNGIVNLPTGSGFAGKLTGADEIDSRVNVFGTGTGNGINGQTPIQWNNLENFTGGNIFEWVSGINILNDGTCRVTKSDGTGSLNGVMPAGSYETLSDKIPLTDGFISKIQTTGLGALLSISSEHSGTSSTYFCDRFYYPRVSVAGARVGGSWDYQSSAGINHVSTWDGPTYSHKSIGTRLLYIPQT